MADSPGANSCQQLHFSSDSLQTPLPLWGWLPAGLLFLWLWGHKSLQEAETKLGAWVDKVLKNLSRERNSAAISFCLANGKLHCWFASLEMLLNLDSSLNSGEVSQALQSTAELVQSTDITTHREWASRKQRGGPLETNINIIYLIKLPYWGFLAWVKHHLSSWSLWWALGGKSVQGANEWRKRQR